MNEEVFGSAQRFWETERQLMDNDRRIGREEYLCIIRSMLAVVAILKSGPLRLLLVPKLK